MFQREQKKTVFDFFFFQVGRARDAYPRKVPMVDPSRNNAPTIVCGVYCDAKQLPFSSEFA